MMNLNTTIAGNVFYKDIDDFGYAMEIGSASTGVISGNTIYGYDPQRLRTAAALPASTSRTALHRLSPSQLSRPLP